MKKQNRGITIIVLMIIIAIILFLVVLAVVANRNLNRKNETVDSIKLNIGDYVNYTPKGTPYETKYTYKDGVTTVDTLQSKYSGYSSDQDIYLQNTKWRILDIKENGEIELISEKEVYIGNAKENTETLYFQGATGYNNGVELLNDICRKLYGTGDYAIGARSLNIEDIQDKMDKTVWDWRNYKNLDVDTGKYGGTKTYEGSDAYYPARWKDEVTGKVNGASTNGTLEQSSSAAKLIPRSTEESAVGEKNGLTYYPENTENASITITQTYWENSSLEANNFKKGKHYNLLITDENNHTYNNWIASRCVNARSGYTFFGLSYVLYGGVHGDDLFESDSIIIIDEVYGVRPVVTLDSSVLLELDTENSTEDVTYWNLPKSN